MLNEIFESDKDRYIVTVKLFDIYRNWYGLEDENPFFNSLDAICLYGMISAHKPKEYIEIGSGYSTLVASHARHDHCEAMTIHSIDPEPRIKVNALCDEVFRRKLLWSDVDWITSMLNEDDILFVDGSHVADNNDSDVTILFTGIIPALRPGVLVHFHDIWLPEDYPDKWSERRYNEQYVLATYLANTKRARILLPNGYISTLGQYGVGKSFWFVVL